MSKFANNLFLDKYVSKMPSICSVLCRAQGVKDVGPASKVNFLESKSSLSNHGLHHHPWPGWHNSKDKIAGLPHQFISLSQCLGSIIVNLYCCVVHVAPIEFQVIVRFRFNNVAEAIPIFSSVGGGAEVCIEDGRLMGAVSSSFA